MKSFFWQSKQTGSSAEFFWRMKYRRCKSWLLVLFQALLLFLFASNASASYAQREQSTDKTSTTATPFVFADHPQWLLAEYRQDHEGRKRSWQELSPEEKARIRQRRQRFESLPPEHRRRLRDARERFQKMTPEQRQTLRRKWQEMSPEERRNMVSKSKKHPR